jgi:hypothetical protein
MERLQQHVEHLFHKYKKHGSKQIQELKQEVYSNLEAKFADLMANGMERSEAIRQATQSITSVDHLIDRNRLVYVNRYLLEYVQMALLYLLIAWIVVMPIQILHMGVLLHLVLLVLIALIGLAYLILLTLKRRGSGFWQKTATLDLQAAFTLRKIGWLVWGLFIIISVGFTTALQFGSNIWFGRPIEIAGPYQFAVVAIRYALPFFSILVPMLLVLSPKLITKHEVDDHE